MPDSDDWKFLQESLQPCLSALRSTFDQDAYDMCLEQRGDVDDSVAVRTKAISSVVDDIVECLTAAMKSDRARQSIHDYDFQIRRLLKREVNIIFSSIEELPQGPSSEKRYERVYDRPKIPPSAYFIFMSHVRAQCEAEPGTTHALVQKAQAVWKDMGAEDRKKYEVEASMLKATYEQQLVDFRELGYYKAQIRT